MKLLHTGDLHLDSPFSKEGVMLAQERREEQRSVLRSIFDCAKREGCDMILIAGDLLDGRYVTPETSALLLRLLREADCLVVIAPGNHDPYVEGSFYRSAELPENVFVFSSPELQCFEFEPWGACVYGYAFVGNALMNDPLEGQTTPPNPAPIRLLCAHAELDVPLSRYAPIRTEEIQRMGIQYAALGHVHTREERTERDGSKICYCGIPQGRSFDECGEGGVWLVEVEEDAPPKVEWRRISSSRYEIVELELDAESDADVLRQKIEDAVSEATKTPDTHLRLILTGTVEPELLEEALVATNQEEQMRSVQIKNLTVPYADSATLQKDVGIKGAFYRSLLPSLDHEDPTVRRRARQALAIGLAALEGRKIPDEEERV